MNNTYNSEKMTTAARPTFEPAQGGRGKGEGDLSALSKQYSSRDLPGQTKLKTRFVMWAIIRLVSIIRFGFALVWTFAYQVRCSIKFMVASTKWHILNSLMFTLSLTGMNDF